VLVVVDTNIVFSALLKEHHKFRKILQSDNIKFISPYRIFVEIFKNKERIMKFTKLSEEKVLDMLIQIISKIDFINYNSLSLNSLSESYS